MGKFLAIVSIMLTGSGHGYVKLCFINLIVMQFVHMHIDP